jgi:hypothetical protein
LVLVVLVVLVGQVQLAMVRTEILVAILGLARCILLAGAEVMVVQLQRLLLVLVMWVHQESL